MLIINSIICIWAQCHLKSNCDVYTNICLEQWSKNIHSDGQRERTKKTWREDSRWLLATTTTGLENLIKSVKEYSEQKGLFLNVKKTQIMSTDRRREEAVKNIDREEIKRVSSFEYLGSWIQANGKTTPEIRRRLAMATSKLNKMANVWKGQCLDMKIRVVKSTVFPTATYGCEAWTINKTDGKLITAFEMKCYKKILENTMDR